MKRPSQQLHLLRHPGAPRRPRLGIDLHCIDGPHQGMRSHLLGLVPEVIPLCPEIDFICFLHDTEGLRESDPSWQLPNVKLVSLPRSSSATRLLWQLPRLSRLERLDSLHVQCTSPPLSSTPQILTLHDVPFESHPQLFPKLFRLRASFTMRRSARRAQHVVTVSNYSKQEIHGRYGVELERLTVIHNAVDATRFHPGHQDAHLVHARGLVPKGYILSVGRIETRRNYIALAKAHAALGASAPPLVIVGQKGMGANRILHKMKSQIQRGLIRVLQDVTDDELPALYRHAQVFCYPSQSEGFGMPPLEAMASGVAVITANTTALPEVVGPAGLKVDVNDPEALAGALRRLVFQPHERAQLAAAALVRSRRFQWRHSAQKLSAVYRASLGIASTAVYSEAA